MPNIAVIGLLEKNNTFLFLRCANVSFGAGMYSMPGGKVEIHETALQAIHREITEETGISIPEDDFQLVYTFHRKGTNALFIALIFKADMSNMSEPYNAEQAKCDDMQFFSYDQLSDNILPAHKQAIACIQQKITYSEHGW